MHVCGVDKFEFAAGFALPTDPEFWLSLFEEAKGWGLMTYEQVFFLRCQGVTFF
jgi:hypothetical protein